MSLKQFIVGDNGSINLATIGQGLTYSGGTFSNEVQIQDGLLLDTILVQDGSVDINRNYTTLYQVYITNTNGGVISSLSLPNLTNLTLTGLSNAYPFRASSGTKLTSISMPSLVNANGGGGIYIESCSLLTHLDISGLTSSGNINLQNNISLTQSTFNIINAKDINIGQDGGSNGFVSLDLSDLIVASSSRIYESNLTSLNLSNLTTLNNPDAAPFLIDSTLITSLNLGQLTTALSGITIQSNSNLSSITINSLTSVGVSTFYIDTFSGTTIDISALVTAGAITIINNASLTSIDISNACTCLSLNFSGNALDATSVNNILIDLDTAGQSNGSVDLSAGTNAAPTGGGITAAANLTGNGWTVTTN